MRSNLQRNKLKNNMLARYILKVQTRELTPKNLSKETNYSYNYCCEVLNALERAGILEKRKPGVFYVVEEEVN